MGSIRKSYQKISKIGSQICQTSLAKLALCRIYSEQKKKSDRLPQALYFSDGSFFVGIGMAGSLPERVTWGFQSIVAKLMKRKSKWKKEAFIISFCTSSIPKKGDCYLKSGKIK